MTIPFLRRRFVSLKWKWVASFSLLLLAVNLGLAMLARDALQDQFAQHRQRVAQAQQQQINGLLESGKLQLQQMAAALPLLAGDLSDPPTALMRLFQQQGSLLELEWGLKFALWVDGRGEARFQWGVNQLPTQLAESVRQVQREERPVGGILCDRLCEQYLATPILYQGRDTGVLILGRSLVELMLSFRQLSGADLAVVSLINRSIGRPSRMIAATRAPTIGPLVEHLLVAYSEPLLAGQTFSVRWQGADFSIRQPMIVDERGFNFLIIEDISDNLSSIQRNTRNSILAGVVGLLLSELVLIGLMWRPMRRLRRIATKLPLLAADGYQQFRQQFGSQVELDEMPDELDTLEHSAFSLAVQLEQSERNLIWLADHDPLTGLFNRRRFGADFARIVKQAVKQRRSGALLYFDLDQFKYVNDTSGHRSGDILLRLVAEQVRTVVSEEDLLGRLGGDEFALVCPDMDRSAAEQMARRLQEALSQVTLPGSGHTHRASASIGVVLFPEGGDDVEQLLGNGDLAMYQAKDAGRGCYHLFSSEEGARENLEQRMIWHDEVKLILNSDSFLLYFQPIFDLSSNRISHHEVLLRIREPDGGVSPPGRFIQEAEESGLIDRVDRRVLEMAISRLAQMSQDGSRPSLAINLSGKNLDADWVAPLFERLLRQFDLSPGQLIVEITETAAVSDILAASKLMQQLKELGCRFALDDFGVGFSSFYDLKRLPVDFVKIDGAFIRNLSHSPDDQLFVRALNEVAQGLGKQTVAEFVEDQATLDLLGELGVNYAQGFFVGKPAAEPQHEFNPGGD